MKNEEMKEFILELSEDKKAQTQHALDTQNVALIEFILDDKNYWKNLEFGQMFCSINAFEDNPNELKNFILEDRNYWKDLDYDEMENTFAAFSLDVSLGLKDFIIQDKMYWKDFTAEEMDATIDAFEKNNQKLSTYILENRELWKDSGSIKMVITTAIFEADPNCGFENFMIENMNDFELLEPEKIKLTAEAFEDDPNNDLRRLIVEQTPSWISLSERKMEFTIDLFKENANKEIREFVGVNMNYWKNLSLEDMELTIHAFRDNPNNGLRRFIDQTKPYWEDLVPDQLNTYYTAFNQPFFDDTLPYLIRARDETRGTLYPERFAENIKPIYQNVVAQNLSIPFVSPENFQNEIKRVFMAIMDEYGMAADTAKKMGLSPNHIFILPLSLEKVNAIRAAVTSSQQKIIPEKLNEAFAKYAKQSAHKIRVHSTQNRTKVKGAMLGSVTIAQNSINLTDSTFDHFASYLKHEDIENIAQVNRTAYQIEIKEKINKLKVSARPLLKKSVSEGDLNPSEAEKKTRSTHGDSRKRRVNESLFTTLNAKSKKTKKRA